MSNYSIWVPGSAAISSYGSQVINGAAIEYTLDAAGSNNDALIVVPIATPVIAAGSRLKLIRIFFLFAQSDGVSIEAISCMDGPTTIQDFTPDAVGPVNYVGANGFNDIGVNLDNVTRFELTAPHSMIFGLAIAASVKFTKKGFFGVAGAGADFTT